jgi:cytochrome c biogenesis protein CcmG/thiol:disulfide interchange protein DsbE
LSWDKGVTLRPTKAQLAAEAAKRNAQGAAGEFVTIPARLLTPLEKWTGADLDGKPWSTSSLTGKVTVVNIWASWCGPCKEEWPVLQQAAAEHPGVRFLGINTQDRLDKAREWLAANPSGYLHVFDERGSVKSSLTTVPSYALPITFVLDSKGRIAAWITGAIKVDPLRKVLKQIK